MKARAALSLWDLCVCWSSAWQVKSGVKPHPASSRKLLQGWPGPRLPSCWFPFQVYPLSCPSSLKYLPGFAPPPPGRLLGASLLGKVIFPALETKYLCLNYQPAPEGADHVTIEGTEHGCPGGSQGQSAPRLGSGCTQTPVYVLRWRSTRSSCPGRGFPPGCRLSWYNLTSCFQID